jgi:hypothetical protein
LQALLQLGRKNLLLGEGLRLGKSSHEQKVEGGGKIGKQYSCQRVGFFCLALGIDLASYSRMNPKKFSVALIAAAVFASTLLSPTRSGGQTGDDLVLAQLATDLAAQQATIADNQAKIDAKLATIAENIRQARIMAGRGK